MLIVFALRKSALIRRCVGRGHDERGCSAWSVCGPRFHGCSRNESFLRHLKTHCGTRRNPLATKISPMLSESPLARSRGAADSRPRGEGGGLHGRRLCPCRWAAGCVHGAIGRRRAAQRPRRPDRRALAVAAVGAGGAVPPHTGG